MTHCWESQTRLGLLCLHDWFISSWNFHICFIEVFHVKPCTLTFPLGYLFARWDRINNMKQLFNRIITKVVFDISHKISNPYIERCAFCSEMLIFTTIHKSQEKKNHKNFHYILKHTYIKKNIYDTTDIVLADKLQGIVNTSQCSKVR